MPLRDTWRALWLGLLVLVCSPLFTVELSSLTSAELPQFNQGKWPFHPPRRPALPAVKDQAWVANPIDAFILAALEAEELAPNRLADKRTLLRRVTFDLTGLAPTVAEERTFLADDSPEAYARLVDRLLDSPRYGERWAQHWLDVVRYAESDGFNQDAIRPLAHRYRDYVIRAFNADLPYDRFIRQQLAGDELEPDNHDALVATGLNRLYPDEYNAANVLQRRQQIHDDVTEATGLAFLGLTMGCAACHDHKFDPISQVDYYRLQAFFAPMLPRDDVPLEDRERVRRHERDQAVWEEATQQIRTEMDTLVEPFRQAALDEGLEKFAPEIRQCFVKPASERTAMDQQLAFQMMKYIRPKLENLPAKLKGEAKERYQVLQRELKDYDHLRPAPLEVAMTVVDAVQNVPPTHRLAGGDYRKPLEQVQPGFPAFLGASEPVIVPTAGNTSGRRAALATWLTRPDHPLTARVMVNRLWHYHFGRGIVGTPNDFGAMGQTPTHPELLDWLAVEFIEQGWSLKAMHRLMVTSAAYRQASTVDLDNPLHARALDRDSENHLLWHARRKRLEGEAVRDVMLQLAGQLNERMFGASARPELPRGVAPKLAWQPDAKPADRDRRSIYLLVKRNLRYPLLDVFDLPDMHNSCPQRSATVTAPQALALMNGEFAQEQARRWSGRLLAEHPQDADALVRAAFDEAFGRPADDEELRAAGRFLTEQSARITASGQGTSPDSLPSPSPSGLDPARAAAVVDFCHALLNSNELVYVD